MRALLAGVLMVFASPAALALAVAASQPPPVFPDAPPPPPMTETVAPDCCTTQGRLRLAPAPPDAAPHEEGAACEARDAQARALPGKVCY